jgi:hypothetical protein
MLLRGKLGPGSFGKSGQRPARAGDDRGKRRRWGRGTGEEKVWGRNEGEEMVGVRVWGVHGASYSVLRVWTQPGRVVKLDLSFATQPG